MGTHSRDAPEIDFENIAVQGEQRIKCHILRCGRDVFMKNQMR